MLETVPVPPLGKNRDRFKRYLNKKVGEGNWYWAFKIGKSLYSWDLGMQLYEDSYWSFFRNNLTLFKELVKNYGDVCEFNKQDMESGTDYRKQTQDADHYQDIAIRRCLRRFGVWFRGSQLLKLPGSKYGDDKVPFHLSHLTKGPARVIVESKVVITAVKSVDKFKLSEILIR